MRHGKAATGAVLLLLAPATSRAADPAAAPAHAPAKAAAADAKKAAPPDVEGITVTASRRSTRLSRTPVSASAYSQRTLDLKGARSAADIARFTPGVSFDQQSNNISIRGIDSEAGSGTTGIYIDDTPVQIRNLGFNAENSLPDLFDLKRVEVLRGPQGTLFGAGSEGGTVRYITPPPSLYGPSAYGRASISASGEGAPSYEGGLAYGAPLIPGVLGFRVSASHEIDGGFLDHLDYRTGDTVATNTNRTDLNVVRAAIAWAPSEALIFTPAILYQSRLRADTDAYFEGLSDPARGVFRTNSPEYVRDNDRFYLPSLDIKWNPGRVTVVSDTSYLHRDNLTGYNGTIYNLAYYNTLLDPSSPYFPLLIPTGINPSDPAYYSPSRIDNDQRNITQEFRLQSNDTQARLLWTLGFFYQHDEQLSREQIQDPVANDLFVPVFGQTIESYFGAPLAGGLDSYIDQTRSLDEQEALFADGTLRIWRGIKFEAGVRYAHTRFSFTQFADGSQNGGFTSASGAKSENPVTPKFTLYDQIDPANLVYVAWAKGYRVGGANAPVPADVCAADFANFGIEQTPTSYNSDTVKSWEIGSKHRVMNGRIDVAFSAYTIDWNNIQQNVLLPICAYQYTANLGRAVSRGFDAEATLHVGYGIDVDTSFGFNDTHFTTASEAGTSGGALLARPGDTLGQPGTSGEPDWKWQIGAQWTRPEYGWPFRNARPYARADYQYVGPPKGTQTFRDPLTASYDPGYARTAAINDVSLRAGLLMRGGVTLSVFADNLLDAAPRLTQYHEALGSELYYDTTLRPRYVGLELLYRN